jgi:hypothetical protein
MNEIQSKRRIRLWLTLFIIGLVLSGVTAFPIETELAFMSHRLATFPEFMGHWITTIYNAVRTTNQKYPWLSYGTDWLAFGHLVIAVIFLGPLKDPVKNIWVIQFGMIARIMVFPLAFIAGPIRHIPFYWRLIDCSFGVFGLIPLTICYSGIKRLEKLQKGE